MNSELICVSSRGNALESFHIEGTCATLYIVVEVQYTT